MRACILLVLLSLTGCSAFHSMLASATSQPSYDPSKIYLSRMPVMIDSKYADHYACPRGPVFCDRFGREMECRCLNN